MYLYIFLYVSWGFGNIKKCYVGANDVWNNPTTLTMFDQAEVWINFITYQGHSLSTSCKKMSF